jgi:hypothetical protein
MKRSAFLVLAGMVVMSPSVWSMSALTDKQMSEHSGQALLNLGYVAPGESGNPNTNVGFYRLSLSSDLNLNANISKLQLGCGGVNGASGCDVDIDRVRFTGFVTANNIKNEQGPATDFLLRDPYIELAIKNPTSASTREMVGMRFGARQAAGMMSFGERPYNADGTALANNDPSTHSGINSLTADMDIYVNRGVVPIRFCLFGCFGDATEANANNQATINLNTPNVGDNIFLDQFYSRASSFKLGELKTETDILGLDVPASLVQDFRFIHNIAIGTAGSPASDFYISLSELGDNLVADTDGDLGNRPTNMKPVNSANWIKWQKLSSPTTWSASARGWSFSLPEVRVEDFRAAPIKVTALGAFGVALENLDLKQVPADNCYGSLTFC